MYLDTGVQSPQSSTIICFDKSIAYSVGNVKTFGENFGENSKESRGKISHKTTNAVPSAIRGGRKTTMDMPLISVSKQPGTNKPFDVTSIGLETDRKYTVAEFNEAIKKSNDIWRNSWDGFGDPKNTAIITIENLHKEPCTYRVNLADEYNSIQDIVNFNPFPPYLNLKNAVEDPIEVLNKAEAMSKNNADLSAARGERSNLMEHNTKMGVSSMVMLEGSNTKAVASVTINDEFVLKGIKVFEGEKGLFVAMPSRKMGDEYADVCFPITAEAREQLHNAVLERYENMTANGLEKFQAEKKDAPEQSTSKISVSLHSVNDEKTKAAGQIIIDDCIVISGVKIKHGTNSKGIEKDFVSMPQYQTQAGEFNQYAHAITKDCYEKVNNAVLGAYEKLGKTEYRGAKFAELGGKENVFTQFGLNSQYARKVMDALDKQGVKYFSKSFEGKTSISVNKADKNTLDKTQKDVNAALKQANKQTQNNNKPEHKSKKTVR